MPGRLTVCPTPIGNLGDLTPRAREVLAGADLVACEDTRRAGRLYERLEIEPPRLVSHNEQNEDRRSVQLAQQIERGARVALITDAGMPGISDPGYRLVRACIDRDLEIEVLPGPSVIPTAYNSCGYAFSTRAPYAAGMVPPHPATRAITPAVFRYSIA